MARIRSVHPSLFTDEAWVSCGPLARILYIGLWTDADDQGVFEWKPLQIKMRLLPGDNGDASEFLAELTAVGLIKPFEFDGKRYGAIANFRKFQRPQKPNAIHPLPDFIAEYVGLSATDTAPVADQYDTGTVIPPQMEDGGGKGGEKREESFALVVPASPEPTPAAPRPARKRPDYPAEFEAAWKAYPHVEGRSSKPDALVEWKLLPPDEKSALPAAIARFRPKVAEACGDRGAPCMSRWLKKGKHLNFQTGGDGSQTIKPEVWARAVQMWANGDGWSDSLGPAPDQPSTRVPRELLIGSVGGPRDSAQLRKAS